MNKQSKLQLIQEEINDLLKCIRDMPIEYQNIYTSRLEELYNEFLDEVHK